MKWELVTPHEQFICPMPYFQPVCWLIHFCEVNFYLVSYYSVKVKNNLFLEIWIEKDMFLHIPHSDAKQTALVGCLYTTVSSNIFSQHCSRDKFEMPVINSLIKLYEQKLKLKSSVDHFQCFPCLAVKNYNAEQQLQNIYITEGIYYNRYRWCRKVRNDICWLQYRTVDVLTCALLSVFHKFQPDDRQIWMQETSRWKVPACGTIWTDVFLTLSIL